MLPLPAGHDSRFAPVVAGWARVLAVHGATLSGKHPPNSLAAIAECVRARVPRLEVDVRFLADDAIALFHDARLEAETFSEGPVARLNREEARAVRLRADGVTGLAFLEEAVELLRGGSSLLQVDLKLMRAMTGGQLAALTAALVPVRDQVLIGSQAHWNLRGLAKAGFAIALDPTLHWRYGPGGEPPGWLPARVSPYGMRDDAPVAHMPGLTERDYYEARLADLVALVPACEWMVDRGTLLHLRTRGFALGEALAARGVALAAWTVHDDGPATAGQLGALFQLGTTTVITDAPGPLAGYCAGL